MPSLGTHSFPANTGVGPGKNHLTSPCGLYSSASEKLGLGKGTGTGFLFSAGYWVTRHSALLQHAGIFSSPAKFSPGWVLCYSWVQEQSLAQRKGLTWPKIPQLSRGRGESTGQLKVMMVKALQWKGEIVRQLHTEKPNAATPQSSSTSLHFCSLKKLPLPTGSHHSSCSGWARGTGASLPQAWLESHTSPSINCLLPWHHSSQKSYTNNRGSLSQNEECSALELKMPLAHKK